MKFHEISAAEISETDFHPAIPCSSRLRFLISCPVRALGEERGAGGPGTSVLIRSKAPRTPYAHVTFPFGNPLGYHGERPLLVAPFSTESADV